MHKHVVDLQFVFILFWARTRCHFAACPNRTMLLPYPRSEKCALHNTIQKKQEKAKKKYILYVYENNSASNNNSTSTMIIRAYKTNTHEQQKKTEITYLQRDLGFCRYIYIFFSSSYSFFLLCSSLLLVFWLFCARSSSIQYICLWFLLHSLCLSFYALQNSSSSNLHMHNTHTYGDVFSFRSFVFFCSVHTIIIQCYDFVICVCEWTTAGVVPNAS